MSDYKKFEVQSANGHWLAFVYAESQDKAAGEAMRAFPGQLIRVRPCMGVRTGRDATLLVVFEREALKSWSRKNRQAAIRCQATGQRQRDLFNATSKFWSKPREGLKRARFGSVWQAKLHRHGPAI